MKRQGVRGVALVLLLLGGASQAGADERRAGVERALGQARQFLIGRQGEDGAWRSGVHGSFKDGPSLTPLALRALRDLRRGEPVTAQAYDRGIGYLAWLVQDPKGQEQGWNFPLYTSALGAEVLGSEARLSGSKELERARDVYVQKLRALQLNEANGWMKDDPHYGGWGYHPRPVRDADHSASPLGPPQANISATAFAIEALASLPVDDRWEGPARIFIERCQNVSLDEADAHNGFDDGGFIFAPGDIAKNKPGASGVDARGRQRLHSYGSATADGLRCLLHLKPKPGVGLNPAIMWLYTRFNAEKNPGNFNADRRDLAEATKFYWLWTASVALRRAEVDLPWRAAVADELLKLQKPDGSWVNRFSDTREDDPIVATSFAVMALIEATAP